MARYLMLFTATALAGGAFFAVSSLPAPSEQNNDRLAELLDPVQNARLACRGVKGSALAAAFRVSKAQAAASTSLESADRPSLYKGLGEEHVEISTESSKAQAYFDQGLRFAFGFNHHEAARAFREAQRHDSQCAMCYWGEALVLGPNINAPMDVSAHSPALEALATAIKLAPHATDMEQALINALDTRYSIEFTEDRSDLDDAYANAMMAVAQQFEEQNHIQILAAEAIMDAQPWIYWEPDGQTPTGRAGHAITMIENVLARDPNNAAAIHLYIHLVEASAAPERAEPYADRLAALMPSAGHIVHMPSHLYYRIGRYRDSIKTNVKAIAADEAYFDVAGRNGIYGYGYYPHNVHFALSSSQMAGDEERSHAMASKLGDLIPVDAALAVPAFMQPIVAAPYFSYAQFPDQSLRDRMPMPDARMPYVLAMWHYMKGSDYIRLNKKNDVNREVAAINAIKDNADFSAMEDGGAPATVILDIAIHVLQGRAAMMENDYRAAIPFFKRATELQGSLPYMEPPYWYYPVGQSLGAAQLLAGSADEAVQTLRQSLYRSPNNAYALYALMHAEKARGQTEASKAAKKAYKAAWMGKDAPDLERM